MMLRKRTSLGKIHPIDAIETSKIREVPMNKSILSRILKCMYKRSLPGVQRGLNVIEAPSLTFRCRTFHLFLLCHLCLPIVRERELRRGSQGAGGQRNGPILIGGSARGSETYHVIELIIY